MTLPCKFTDGKCDHCGDAVKGECEGWNATDDAHAKLAAAAKLAMDALKPGASNEIKGKAITALRKAGIK